MQQVKCGKKKGLRIQILLYQFWLCQHFHSLCLFYPSSVNFTSHLDWRLKRSAFYRHMKGTLICTATSRRLIEEDLILVPLTLITVWMRQESSTFYVYLPRNYIRCKHIFKTRFHCVCSDSQLDHSSVDNLLCRHLSGGHNWQQFGHVCCVCVQVNYYIQVYSTVILFWLSGGCKLSQTSTLQTWPCQMWSWPCSASHSSSGPPWCRGGTCPSSCVSSVLSCKPYRYVTNCHNDDKLLILNMIKTR